MLNATNIIQLDSAFHIFDGLYCIAWGLDAFLPEGSSLLNTHQLDFFGCMVGAAEIGLGFLLAGISENPTKTNIDFVSTKLLLMGIFNALSILFNSTGMDLPMFNLVWSLIYLIPAFTLQYVKNETCETKDKTVVNTDKTFYSMITVMMLVNVVTNAIEPSIGMMIYNPYVSYDDTIEQAIKTTGAFCLFYGMYYYIISVNGASSGEHYGVGGDWLAWGLVFLYMLVLKQEMLVACGVNQLAFAGWMLTCFGFARYCFLQATEGNFLEFVIGEVEDIIDVVEEDVEAVVEITVDVVEEVLDNTVGVVIDTLVEQIDETIETNNREHNF